MIDKGLIGHAMPRVTFEVEKGRLQAFARAIGETRPEYIDEAAAKAAGHRSLLVPPTFIFGAELDAGTVWKLLDLMKVDLGKVLHGEQSFTYRKPMYAGDVLTIDVRITDIADKKGGAMEFVTKETTVTNQLGERVGEMRGVIVVRNK